MITPYYTASLGVRRRIYAVEGVYGDPGWRWRKQFCRMEAVIASLAACIAIAVKALSGAAPRPCHAVAASACTNATHRWLEDSHGSLAGASGRRPPEAARRALGGPLRERRRTGGWALGSIEENETHRDAAAAQKKN